MDEPAPANPVVNPSQGRQSSRIAWVDMARGMAALGVVFMHVQQGLGEEGFGQVPFGDQINAIGDVIRMQTMMFVAGIFLLPALRKGRLKFLYTKARTLAWPFLIWSVIYYALWQSIGLIAYNPIDLTSVIKLLIKPILHLWFLQYLLFYFAISYALISDNPSYKRILYVATIVALPFIAFAEYGADLIGASATDTISKMLSDNYSLLEQRLARAGTLFIFFMLGVAAFKFGTDKISSALSKRTIQVASVLMLVSFLMAIYIPHRKYYASSLPISFIAVIAFLYLSQCAQYFRYSRSFFSYLSSNAIEIYILHYAIAYFVRHGLGILGLHNIELHLILGLALTLLCCLALASLSKKWTRGILFALPSSINFSALSRFRPSKKCP